MLNKYDEYLKLLQEYDSLPDILKSESIFNIAGYPHYENVCSNILAFYLNPTNEHGLGNLFLSSFMNLAKGNVNKPENIQINREVFTLKGGRLDVVIETDNQIIGIENKLFHHLNNDLADYSDSLEEWAKPNQLSAIKIILSLRKEPESNGFICITYDELWEEIRERLGTHITTVSQKWLLYLVDFMSAIDNLSGENMELDTNDQFFIKNDKKVTALINDRNKFIAKLNDKIRQLLEMIEKPRECERQWIYSKSWLVHDFNLSNHQIAFDLYISPGGWELQLFGRNKKSQSYLSELMSMPPLDKYESELRDSRFIMEKIDLKTDLKEIKVKLINWIGELIQSDGNKNAVKAINSDS